MRLPKAGFYAHQVMWDGWVDVERPRSHIIGHWNYAPGVVKDVMVVSSADSVELLLNGKSLGRGVRSDGFLFTFKDVAWARRDPAGRRPRREGQGGLVRRGRHHRPGRGPAPDAALSVPPAGGPTRPTSPWSMSRPWTPRAARLRRWTW